MAQFDKKKKVFNQIYNLHIMNAYINADYKLFMY